MGARPPDGLRQPTPEKMPHRPGMPPEPSSDTEGAQFSGIDGVPPGYVYIHTPLPIDQFLNLDAYAKDRKSDRDFNPDLVTDDGTSTG